MKTKHFTLNLIRSKYLVKIFPSDAFPNLILTYSHWHIPHTELQQKNKFKAVF